jgi:hypothetical protein
MSEIKKGRILRLKSGYNPNSSSVGSHIPAFLFFAIGSGAVTVIVSQMLASAGSLINKSRPQVQSEQKKDKQEN